MKIYVNAEERAHVYTFVGGITYVPGLNRHVRRKLTKLAQKFGPGATSAVTLNQTNLDYLITLLAGAIVSGEKAKVTDTKLTQEQKDNIDNVNIVFGMILKKIEPRSLNKINHSSVDLTRVLGSPKTGTLQQLTAENVITNANIQTEEIVKS